MTMTQEQLNKRIAFFAIGIGFLAWMAVKLPMPALPQLVQYFHTSPQVFKVSVTLNLIGFSVSQIFWGPFSDRFGRRLALIAAFGVAIVGTVLAMLAVNIEMYLLGRFVEGFAVGCAAPVGRAVMADKLEKVTLAKVYAWYAIAGILPPAVGPVIGGYILVYFGWRYIFLFFLLLAVMYIIALWRWMPETNDSPLSKIDVGCISRTVRSILKSKQFWVYALIYALINGYMIAYYAAMPFWYVSQFHLAEDVYAWLAFVPIAAYIASSMMTNKLLNKFSMNRLLMVGLLIALTVGVVTIVLNFISKPSIVILTLLMSLFSMASGIVTPMTNASLMCQFRDKVTILSALLSGLRVAVAGGLVLISTNISLDNYLSLGLYTLIVPLIGFVFFIKS